jgi:hypothetical protein
MKIMKTVWWLDLAMVGLAGGAEQTIWSGFKGKGEGEAVSALAAGGGTLRIASEGTDWGFGLPRGPFLFRLAEGDFV